MRNFTIFFVALITLLCIVPADAQRRQREANKQTTVEKKPAVEKQTTSTDTESGRRRKSYTVQQKVPCTLTLSEAPVIRGFSLGTTLAQIRERFRDTTVKVTAVAQPTGSNKFAQKYVLYSSGATVPDPTSGSLREWEKLNPDVAKTRQPRNQRQEEAKETFKNVEEIRLWFYGGNENPVLFAYIIVYDSNLFFNSSDEIKGIYLKNYKIPTGSWTPVTEDRSRHDDWDSYCTGWRVYFWTSPKTGGLVFTIFNTDIEENLDGMEKEEKKKKTTTFKP